MSEDRLSPGDVAPDFTLADDQGGEVTLSALRGRKVIVYFYPAAMTPGCTTQANDFSDALEDLQAAGYEVLGISPDQPDRLVAFRQQEGIGITLLSDPERVAMTAYSAYGDKMLYGASVRGVIRSTFVIDEEGRVEVARYNVKATGHVAKLRRDLGLADAS